MKARIRNLRVSKNHVGFEVLVRKEDWKVLDPARSVEILQSQEEEVGDPYENYQEP